jgi:hypothetical protein
MVGFSNYRGDRKTYISERGTITFCMLTSLNEQILIRPLSRESKNMNMAGGWKLKFTFYFMYRTLEQLLLVKWSAVHWNIMVIGLPYSFIWIIIFLDGAFEYAGISRFYVGTNAELLCVEFCNFVQCHILLGYLCCYCFIKSVLNIRDATQRPKNTRSYILP